MRTGQKNALPEHVSQAAAMLVKGKLKEGREEEEGRGGGEEGRKGGRTEGRKERRKEQEKERTRKEQGTDKERKSK